MKKMLAIFFILFSVLAASAFAQIPTKISLQGRVINSTTGDVVTSGNIRVKIVNSSGSTIYNYTHNNVINNGIFDILLGDTYQLNLSYNEDYNLSIYYGTSTTPIGGPYTFRGGQGQINLEDVADVYVRNTGDTMTGNLVVSGANVTADNFFGNISYSYVQNEPWVEGTEADLNVNSSTYWDGGTSQANLNVNSSDYWDNLDSPSDINAGDIYDDNTYVTTSGDNTITGDLTVEGNFTVVGSYVNATVTNQYLNGSFLPSVADIFDIGSPSRKWDTIYVNTVNATTIDGSLDSSKIQNEPWVEGTEADLNVNSSTYWDGKTSQANLNVNSSDYWDNLGGLSDLNNRITLDADNITNEFWVNESGDTMTGNLNIEADLVVDADVLYVNSTSDVVGIGTTNPSHTLTVIGTVNATSFLGDGSGLTGVGGTVTDVWVNESGDTMTGDLNMSGNDIVNISRVGIGTGTPDLPLDVEVSSGGAATIGSSGNTATGDYAVAMGYDTNASGHYATAMGGSTTASHPYATAMGYDTNASGDHAIAMGGSTTASYPYATAMGKSTIASEYASTAMGWLTTASGSASTAMGQSTTASGSESTAMGSNTKARGTASLATGYGGTTAGGYAAIAMGSHAKALGANSFAWGSGWCGTASSNCNNTAKDIFAIYGGLCIANATDTCPRAGPATLTIRPITSLPLEVYCNSTTEGLIYYNSTRHELCYCNSTHWRQVDNGGLC